jgi:hypothetical protein
VINKFRVEQGVTKSRRQFLQSVRTRQTWCSQPRGPHFLGVPLKGQRLLFCFEPADKTQEIALVKLGCIFRATDNFSPMLSQSSIEVHRKPAIRESRGFVDYQVNEHRHAFSNNV